MSFRTAYGNTHSENGWRMCNRDECVVVPGPGMNTAPLRRGASEIVLGDFVRRHHVEVEPIIGPVWGWSRDNDVSNSNHLAGTAVDIRATVRPWGAKVLGKAVIDRTYGLLDKYTIEGQSGVFWGREWRKPDEMHFQLRWPEGDRRWPLLIAKIQGLSVPNVPNVPPVVQYAPLLKYGSQGAAVLELQRDMNRIFRGYPMMPLMEDAEFGPATASAVREFQRRAGGLDVDGEVGPKTWTALNKYGVRL